MLNVGVHFYVRQPVGLRVLSYVRQHGRLIALGPRLLAGRVASYIGLAGHSAARANRRSSPSSVSQTSSLARPFSTAKDTRWVP